ncbi:MAG: hypothetical protein CL678_11200 [Bdellovibrionaceae bacterium]|nr:hypothetical protein [Pseudobdellovibrionaceae bacterium]
MSREDFKFYYGPKVRQNVVGERFSLEGTDATGEKLPKWLCPFILADRKLATRQRTEGDLPLEPSALDRFYYKAGQDLVFVGSTKYSRPTDHEVKQYRRRNVAAKPKDTEADNYAELFREEAFKRLVPHPKSGLAQVALAFLHRSKRGVAWILDEGDDFRPWLACTPQKQLVARLVKEMGGRADPKVLQPIRRFMCLPRDKKHEQIERNDMLRVAMVSYTDANPDTTLLNLFLAHFTAASRGSR